MLAECFPGSSRELRAQAVYEALGGSDCFLGLSPDEQEHKIYEALGGTGCFLGLSPELRREAIYVAAGGTEDCFLGRSPGEQHKLFYEVLYANAGSPDNLVDPSCFSGLAPFEQESALFGVLALGLNLHPECSPIAGSFPFTFPVGSEGKYYRAKYVWDNGVNPPLVFWGDAVGPIAAAPPAPSYLVEENFEGVGTPAGWTVIGTVDFDYATSPVQGAQMLRIAADSSATYTTFAEQSDVWAYFRYRADTANGNTATFGFVDAAITVNLACVSVVTNGVGTQEARLFAGGSNSSASSSNIDNGTNYHVWIHFVQNSTCTLYVSSSGTRPSSDGSGNVFLTKTAINTPAGLIVFGTPVTSGQNNIDRVIVSVTEIGNNP